jgi:large subunit ribosomal protein L14e
MFEIGRICMKIAGRDAGKKCVIIDVIDQHYVMIDGQTRRRKCNINHLEPLNQIVQVTKNAPVPEVVRVLKENNIEVEEKKPKAKTSATAKAKTERPKRARKQKEKPVKDTKVTKSAKAAKKKEATAKDAKEEKKPEQK